MNLTNNSFSQLKLKENSVQISNVVTDNEVDHIST